MKADGQSCRAGLVHDRMHDGGPYAMIAQLRDDRLIDDQQPCITAVDDDPPDRTTIELDDVEMSFRELSAIAGRLCLELEFA